MRILLADDHVMVRDGLRPFLLRLDDQVTLLEAGSLAEVLTHLEAGPPLDLLVMDLRMPGMNGLEGLHTVRNRRPEVRMVVLSSIDDPDMVMEIINLGAAGFIPKKLSGAAMVSALQLVLSGERFIPSTLLMVGRSGDGSRGRGPRGAAPLTDGNHTGRLTQREKEVLSLLREGLPNKAIANRLNLSEVTIKSHLFSVFRKLGVANRVQAARVLVDLVDN